MKQCIRFGLALFLTQSVLFCWLSDRDGFVGLNCVHAQENAADARENERISASIASRALTSHPGPLNMVGNLTGRAYCPAVVRLTQEQKDVITKLDDLVRKSLYHSMMADAEPFDGPPAVRRKMFAQNHKRRNDAIDHARRLVFSGLLTEDQAAAVTRRYLEALGIGALNNDDVGVAELIEFTDEQRKKLDEVNAGFLREVGPKIPEAMSPDQRVGDGYNKWAEGWSLRYRQAMWEILTPSQRARWAELTSHRSLSVEPPSGARTALSDAESASVHILELSPIFRAAAQRASAVELSDVQKTLLKDLDEVTRVGLVWIDRDHARGTSRRGAAQNDRAGQIARARAEFLKHAEQVALLGILTARQADLLLVPSQKSAK